ncbi:diguanylate cyclase (plasmid) [Devosia sp. A8/3-2]|nr:diguanylate cyclase [Devosia sp. A8/3-2]
MQATLSFKLWHPGSPRPPCRIGHFWLSGDEFAVSVEHNDVATLAKNIMAAVTEAALCDGHSIMPSVTIGGALLGTDRDCELMRHRADFALYHAKENGRGRFCPTHPDPKNHDISPI